jgi:hypothetical protein
MESIVEREVRRFFNKLDHATFGKLLALYPHRKHLVQRTKGLRIVDGRVGLKRKVTTQTIILSGRLESLHISRESAMLDTLTFLNVYPSKRNALERLIQSVPVTVKYMFEVGGPVILSVFVSSLDRLTCVLEQENPDESFKVWTDKLSLLLGPSCRSTKNLDDALIGFTNHVKMDFRCSRVFTASRIPDNVLMAPKWDGVKHLAFYNSYVNAFYLLPTGHCPGLNVKMDYSTEVADVLWQVEKMKDRIIVVDFCDRTLDVKQRVRYVESVQFACQQVKFEVQRWQTSPFEAPPDTDGILFIKKSKIYKWKRKLTVDLQYSCTKQFVGTDSLCRFSEVLDVPEDLKIGTVAEFEVLAPTKIRFIRERPDRGITPNNWREIERVIKAHQDHPL